MKKIVCLFPGIGYTCDKPLLYYSWKLLKGLDWEIVPVSYTGFPSGVKGHPEKMRQAAHMALDQAEAILKGIDWSDYSDILLIGKSVGTVVCAAYARRHHIPCRHILFTPVEDTFRFVDHSAIVFHGTADPWADTKVIEQNCKQKGIPLYETENANHSLETGDVDFDIQTMRDTMRIVRAYAERYDAAAAAKEKVE
ncbi:MAG: alpha/beta hydrolase [Clostridia bacterium]|nr:alpha/beta hydrolase [Clostridia bacterium]